MTQRESALRTVLASVVYHRAGLCNYAPHSRGTNGSSPGHLDAKPKVVITIAAKKSCVLCRLFCPSRPGFL